MPEQREPYLTTQVERFQVCAADFCVIAGEPVFDRIQQEMFFSIAGSINASMEQGELTRRGAMLVLDLLLDLLKSGRRECSDFADYHEAVATQRRGLKEQQ